MPTADCVTESRRVESRTPTPQIQAHHFASMTEGFSALLLLEPRLDFMTPSDARLLPRGRPVQTVTVVDRANCPGGGPQADRSGECWA